MSGRVILLHGTSSSGKTTTARAIQELSDDPWLRLGIDAFWNAVHERWMEHGDRAAEGFAWMEDARIVPSPIGQQLAAGMRAAVVPVLALAMTWSSMTSSWIRAGSMDGAAN